MLPLPIVQGLEVLTIVGAAPGLSGVIARTEARLQGRRGPRVLQPYFDLAKLFHKEALAPEGSSWVFLAAPVVHVLSDSAAADPGAHDVPAAPGLYGGHPGRRVRLVAGGL